ncbi:MAG: hypothetical protein AAB606_01875 [Patescibacteria group bacterium]
MNTLDPQEDDMFTMFAGCDDAVPGSVDAALAFIDDVIDGFNKLPPDVVPRKMTLTPPPRSSPAIPPFDIHTQGGFDKDAILAAPPVRSESSRRMAADAAERQASIQAAAQRRVDEVLAEIMGQLPPGSILK